MRVSASLLNNWSRCPLMAKFSSIDKLPEPQNAKASFGVIIHKCLEHHLNGMPIDKAVAMFKDYWKNPGKLGVSPDYYPKYTSFGGLMQQGQEILRSYHEHTRWERREIIALEHKFVVPFGEHQLSGIIDLLEMKLDGRGKATLRIVDFKTASRQPSRLQLRQSLQFTCYDWATRQREFWLGYGPEYPGLPGGGLLWERFRDMDRVGVWVHLMAGAKEISAGPRTLEDFQRLYRLCSEIEKAIEHDVYVPTISHDTCSFCPFNPEPCGLPVPDPAENPEILL